MAVLVLARELFVTSARAILEAEGVDYRARAIGKWKMVLQSACLPAVVLLVQVAPEIAGHVRDADGLGGDHRHGAQRLGLCRSHAKRAA